MLAVTMLKVHFLIGMLNAIILSVVTSVLGAKLLIKFKKMKIKIKLGGDVG